MASNIAAPHARTALTGLGIAALALLAAPAMADVQAGVDAWGAGDFASAVVEWQGPAAAGDPDALFNLGQAYRLGRGVEIDNARARKLYEDAARRGHVKAADNLGLMLFQDGEQDKAMPLIRAAAERGEPRAQYVLGLAHFNAEYVQRDWTRAYALMTLANAAGLPQARDALAQMDEYIPQDQRAQAQSLAREFEAGAKAQRSAERASADLATRPQQAAVVTQPAAAPFPASLPAPSPAAPVAVRGQGTWRVQLGAFGVAANADRLWSQLGSHTALAGMTKTLVPSGKLTRLLATGFSSEAEASRACAALKREGQACVVAGQG